MSRPARLRAAALAAGLLLPGCGGGEPTAGGSGLVVEAVVNGSRTELIVYVEDPKLSTLRISNGKRTVTLTCRSHDRQTVIEVPQRWPFEDTDGGTTPPHVHVPIDGAAGRIIDCQLEGTEGPLAGSPELAR